MKLIHIQTGEDRFEDPNFKAIFDTLGIVIPTALSARYGGKTRVFWGDPEFESAFRELYFKRELNPNEYQLR